MHPSDDDIEKLFQEGVEQAHFEYDPGAWTQMEALLDKDDKRRSLWFWLWGGLAMVIGALMLIYFISKNTTSLSENDVKEIDRTEISSIDEDLDAPNTSSSTLNLDDGQTNNGNSTSSLESDNSTSDNLVPDNSISSNLDVNDNAEGLSSSQTARSTNISDDSNGQTTNNDISTNNAPSNNTTGNGTTENNKSENTKTSSSENNASSQELKDLENTNNTAKPENLNNQEIKNLLQNQVLPGGDDKGQVDVQKSEDTNLNDQNPSTIDDNSLEDAVVASNEEREIFDINLLPINESELLAYEVLTDSDIEMSMVKSPNPPEIPKPSKNPIVLSFAFGSQASSTPTTGYNDFDPSFALGVNLFSNKHFSTALGFGYTRDRYTAGQGDYLPWKGYWGQSMGPQSTLADCRILTGNIGFNYFFKDVAKNGFFVGSSALTTFMLTEKYEYLYDKVYPGQKKGWKGERLNNHLLSTLTFTGGYQYYIRNGLSISLIPHYELPIYGIGFGSIKLRSAGVNFGINYNLRK